MNATASFPINLQRRGVSRQAVELLLAFHDIDRPVGRGYEVWALSRERLAAMVRDGLPPAVTDRLRNLILIVAPYRDQLIAAIKGDVSRIEHRLSRGGHRRRRTHRTRG